MFGVDLDLLAQTAHGHPDVGRVRVLGVRPAAGEQGLGGHGLAEVGGQGVEEAGLGGRERHGPAGDLGLAPVQLQGEVRPELQALARHPVAEAAQHPLDPRPQLAVVVGLGDVVLRDLLEDLGLGVGGVDGGEDDDRQVGASLDLARERQTVHAGHEHVDDEQVRPRLGKAAERLVAIAGGLHLVAVGAQLLGEEHEQVGIVIDDEDPRRRDAVGTGAAMEHGRIVAVRASRCQPVRCCCAGGHTWVRPADTLGAPGGVCAQRTHWVFPALDVRQAQRWCAGGSS